METTPIEEWTGERTIWWNPKDHLKEFKQINDYYYEALPHAINKRVVDVGCGNGFGTFLTSLVAREVFGIDVLIHEELGESKFHLPFQAETKFLQMDLEKEPVDITADLCIAIEFMEHLENPDYFLSNLKAQALFFTIPCYGNKNEFHKIEYNEESAKKMVEKHFSTLEYRMEKGHMIGYAFKTQPLP